MQRENVCPSLGHTPCCLRSVPEKCQIRAEFWFFFKFPAATMGNVSVEEVREGGKEKGRDKNREGHSQKQGLLCLVEILVAQQKANERTAVIPAAKHYEGP